MEENQLLKITFKNVGQGDCIFIEWKENSENKIGIIDCNKLSAPNFQGNILMPLKKYKEIEFIILSHPHYDHFSGLLDIFDFCLEEQNKIKINKIFHTLDYHHKYLKFLSTKKILKSDFLNSFSNLHEDKDKLSQLLRKFQEHKYSTGTEECPLNFGFPIYLNDDIEIYCLSPKTEVQDYFSGTFSDNGLSCEFDGKNPNANLLSSVILINILEGCILLTSDATTKTLDRILNEKFVIKKILEQSKFIYAFQIPHHGSKDNHHERFWKPLQINKSYGFISTGNNKHGHPDFEVVKFFDNSIYEVHSTNYINGYKSFYKSNSKYFDTPTFIMKNPEDIVDIINLPLNFDKKFMSSFGSNKEFIVSKNGELSVKPSLQESI